MGKWHSTYNIAIAICKLKNDYSLKRIYEWEVNLNLTEAKFKNWIKNFEERTLSFINKKLVDIIPKNTINNKEFYERRLSLSSAKKLNEWKEFWMSRKEKHENWYDDLDKEDLIKIIEYLKKQIKESKKMNSVQENNWKFECVNDLKKIVNLSTNSLIKIFNIANSRYYERQNKNIDLSKRQGSIYTSESFNAKVKYLFEKSNGRLSCHKMSIKLYEVYRISVDDNTVWKTYKRLGLHSKPGEYASKHKYRETKNTRFNCPNLLKKKYWVRMVSYIQIGRVVSMDFAILDTKKYGHVHLFYIVDVLTYKILSWEICLEQTAEVVLRNLKKLKDVRIVHSDHGTQFSSKLVTDYLKENNIKQSMGRIGKSTDNRWVEYTFGRTRVECLNHEDIENIGIWEIKRIVSDYVYWYNNERPITTLNNLSPNNYILYLKQKNFSSPV